MNFVVSDLLFPGFKKFGIRALSAEYGIEFFYEFGREYYWDEETEAWGKRELTIHAPCVAVNLADRNDQNYLAAFEETFAYAKKVNSGFVVVHTNEGFEGEVKEVQAMVRDRLQEVLAIAKKYGVPAVIENVGLRTKGNVLFTLDEYLALFNEFPEAKALIDTGHAHVNGWNIPEVIEALGDKLIGFHIHDNDGNGDDHLPVGKGTLEWAPLFEAIKKHTPKATLVFEYACGFDTTKELEGHITELKETYKL